MVYSSCQRTTYGLLLVLTILLTGLHFAVAAIGHNYYKVDSHNGVFQRFLYGTSYADKDFHYFAAFLIVAAGLTFIISLILLIAFCANRFDPKTRHVLATFNLMLQFAIAVTLAITASCVSNLREYIENYANWWNGNNGYYQQYQQYQQNPLNTNYANYAQYAQYSPYNYQISGVNDDLELYWKLLLSDTIITFVLQFLYLLFVYFGTLREIETHAVVLTPAIHDPPISANRFIDPVPRYVQDNVPRYVQDNVPRYVQDPIPNNIYVKDPVTISRY